MSEILRAARGRNLMRDGNPLQAPMTEQQEQQAVLNEKAKVARHLQAKYIVEHCTDLMEWLEVQTLPLFEPPAIQTPKPMPGLNISTSELLAYRMGQHSLVQYIRFVAMQKDHSDG